MNGQDLENIPEYAREAIAQKIGAAYESLKIQEVTKLQNDNKEAFNSAIAAAGIKDLGDGTFQTTLGETVGGKADVINILGDQLAEAAFNFGETAAKAMEEYSGSDRVAGDKQAYAENQKLIAAGEKEAYLAKAARSAEEAGFDKATYEEYLAYLQEINPLLETQYELATQVAMEYMELDRGVNNLIDNFDTYKEVIEAANSDANVKNTLEYSQTIRDLGKSFKDVANVDIKDLDDSFLTSASTMDLLEEAAYGSADAIDELRKASMMNIISGAASGVAGAEDIINNFSTFLQDFNMDVIEIGDKFSVSGLEDIFKQMIEMGIITADNVNAILGTIGYEPVVEYVPVSSNSKD